jgi:hypothetical protein
MDEPFGIQEAIASMQQTIQYFFFEKKNVPRDCTSRRVDSFTAITKWSPTSVVYN